MKINRDERKNLMERRWFIRTFLLSSGALLTGMPQMFAMNNDPKLIKISMIYNNIGVSTTLTSVWGLSIWIEFGESALLFDTGGDASVLLKNMAELKLDFGKLKTIVVSHNHWDHINGLEAVLEKTAFQPNVYVPVSDLEEFKNKNPKANCIGVGEPMQINDYCWSTGQLLFSGSSFRINEHALMLIQGDDLVLLTGCSHPGIVELTRRAKETHPDKNIVLVAGGFHLNQYSEEQVQEISHKLKEMEVGRIAPSHCTGTKAIAVFRNSWGEKFLDFNLGNHLNFNDSVLVSS